MKNEFDYLNDVSVDLSGYEAAELTETECEIMKKEVLKKTKKKSKAGRYVAVAAAVALVAAMTQIAFAQGLVDKIVKTVSTGYNTVFQMDDSDGAFELPEALKNKIFDADGNPLNSIKGGGIDRGEYYNADGKRLGADDYVDLLAESGLINLEEVEIHVAKSDDKLIPDSDESIKVFTSQEELQEQLNFKLITPEYLPEGFEFLYCEGFSKSNGELSGDYAVLAYSDGEKKFTIHERVINDETKFETGTSEEVREGEINGCKAAITDSGIIWEQNGVSVDIVSGDSGVLGKELLKVAESTK